MHGQQNMKFNIKECYYEMADEEGGRGALPNLETLLLHTEEQLFFSVTYTFLTAVSHAQYHEH